MQTLCTLSCQASSDSPFNYSWTKDGEVPVSDDTKIMNNIIVLKPRKAEDYGVYVCHAANSFGSTAYNITMSECHKSSTSSDTIKGDKGECSDSLLQQICRICFIVCFVKVSKAIQVLFWVFSLMRQR